MKSGSKRGGRAPQGKAPRRGRVREVPILATPSAQSEIRYIESSALVAATIERDVEAGRAIGGPGRLVTSALTHAEASRAVYRAQIAERMPALEAAAVLLDLETFARRTETIVIGADVLARVGRPFPVEPVRTLDAIHLATIELLGAEPGQVTVVTRDARVRANARAMGWRTE